MLVRRVEPSRLSQVPRPQDGLLLLLLLVGESAFVVGFEIVFRAAVVAKFGVGTFVELAFKRGRSGSSRRDVDKEEL